MPFPPLLVLLATLFLGDLIAKKPGSLVLETGQLGRGLRGRLSRVHVLGKAVEVLLLLGELLPELEELFLLALADGVLL